MKLSIVSTLYQSEPYLAEFYQRVSAVSSKITDDYEFILVNDGSPDKVLTKALQLQKTDPRLTIIDLSRNFGHHEAGMVGLEHSHGDYVFILDSDLEEKPELLEQFWKLLTSESEIDVVYGVQKTRKGSWLERYPGYIFYRTFNQLSETPIPENLLTIRLMKRQFVDAVIQYPEKNLFVAGIMSHAGFNQQAVPIQKLSKKQSSYTFIKKIKLFLTCITSFSSRPLEYMFIVGFFILGFSSLASMVTLFSVFFSIQTLSNSTLIILSASFICGTIISCTGILGLYLGKIYDEVKQRPRAIIKTIYQGKNDDE